MSESKKDNNEKEMIESEIVEVTEEPVDIQPVVKKGSFFGFLAFVLALAAFGLSGYMYYVDHYLTTNNQDNSQDDKASHLLQSSIASLESKSNQFEQLLTTAQKRNQQLAIQLNTLQEQVNQKIASEATISNEEPNHITNQVAKPFDDSAIKQQITDLQNKISQQSQLVEQLQTNLNTSNSQNSQSLEKLSSDLKSQISNQPTSLPVNSEINNSKAIAGSLLQEAYLQLNINGNIVRSQDLLGKTIVQLSHLTGMRYGRLSTELENFSQQLTDLEQPDVDSLKSQIDSLTDMTSQLEFTQVNAAQGADKEASWYDNLISIKKIDANKQPELTKSEQITILNVISNHYQMLKLALMSGNQDLWQSEISQIQSLLSLHFAEGAKDIDQQLATLNALDINLKLPDLETYLKQFNAINLANENE